MSNSIALSELNEAQRLTKDLIRRTAKITGCVSSAQKKLAREIGIAPGTIENLARGRNKGIDGWVRDALRRLVAAEIRAEITELRHELAKLEQTGADPRGSEMAAVRADLSSLLEIVGCDRPKDGQ